MNLGSCSSTVASDDTSIGVSSCRPSVNTSDWAAVNLSAKDSTVSSNGSSVNASCRAAVDSSSVLPSDWSSIGITSSVSASHWATVGPRSTTEKFTITSSSAPPSVAASNVSAVESSFDCLDTSVPLSTSPIPFGGASANSVPFLANFDNLAHL